MKLFSIAVILTFLECYIHQIIQYLGTGFFSFSMITWRFLQIAACMNNLFLFIAEQSSKLYGLIIHPLKDIWLFLVCCFFFFGTFKNTIILNAFIQLLCEYNPSVLFGKCSRVQPTGQCGSPTFSFFRNCPIVFQRVFSILYLHQHCVSDLVFPHLHQYMVSLFLTLVILIGLQRYLFAV